MRATIWKIKVLVETNDRDVVDAKIELIKEAFCGPEHALGPDHRRDPPWFVVTSPLGKRSARTWRKLLNR